MAFGFYIYIPFSPHLMNSLTATVEKQQQQKDQQQPPQKQQQSQQHQEKEKEQQMEVLTPKNQHKLNIIQDPEAKQKSTPGHESAASLKPVLGAKTATGELQFIRFFDSRFPKIFGWILKSPVITSSIPKDLKSQTSMSPSYKLANFP